jgi:hypothetical protein
MRLLPQAEQDVYANLMAGAGPDPISQRYQIQRTLNPDGSERIIVFDAQQGRELTDQEFRLTTPQEQAGGAGPVAILDPAVREAERSQGPVQVIRDNDREQVYRYGNTGPVWRLDKATNTIQEHTIQEGIPEDVKRPITGAASMLVDNPNDFGIFGYSPAALEGTLAGVYGLANLLPGVNWQNDYLDRATERVNEADQNVRDFMGIGQPETPLDVALEIGGSLAIPMPKVPRGIQVIPGRSGGLINNALEATTSGFGGRNIFGRHGGLIHDAGTLVSENLLPLRQGGFVPAVATQGALGVGLYEGLDAEFNIPEYEGIVDAIDEATTYQPTVVDGIPQDIIDGFLALDPNDPATEEAAALILEGIENGEFVAPEPEEPAWRNAGSVVAALAATGLGAYGMRAYTRQAARARLNGSTALGGIEYNPQTTSIGSRAIGSWVQGDQPIREALRNSRRAPEPPTRDPAFLEWFGNSAIRDSNGEPLRVYHGSSQAFDEFSGLGHADNNVTYFSKNPEYASMYARQRVNRDGGNPTVYPAYLSLQNPLVIDAPRGGLIDAVRRRFDADYAKEQRRATFRAEAASAYVPSWRVAELQAQGYDGIVNNAADEIIVFNTGQIKSALDVEAQLFRRNTPNIEAAIRRLDRVTAPSLNTLTTHTIATGEFPNSAIRSQPVAATLEALAKDVDDAEWSVITDGLLARSALDDIEQTGTQSAFNDITEDDLRMMADRLDNDPKLSVYGSAIRQHYRDNLDFMLEQGLINQNMYDGLRQARPNYVHFSRNLREGDTGNTLFGNARLTGPEREYLTGLMERSTEEFGGLQAGRAADPVRELVGETARVVRLAETNRARAEVLDILNNNPAYDKVISRLPAGETPKSGDNIVDVVVDGEKIYYRVTDRALADALMFNPQMAQSTAKTILSIPKRVNEFFLTGPGAPFFALTAAGYDTATGIALRPRGYELGLINEALNRVFPRSGGILDTLKAADPTALISAPVGAARLAYDEFLSGMSRSLTEQLTRNDGLFIRALGPQNTQILRDRLAAAYEGSVRAAMDRYGASTTGLLDASDLNTAPRAMADVAPTFYNRASQRAYQEAINGGAGYLEGVLKGGARSAAARARSSALARLYINTVRLLHEGFRYQAFATNMPKARNAEDMQRIASQTRRISGDVMQRGSGQTADFVTSTGMYVNPAIQGLSQVARQLKDQPITTLTNTAILMTMLTALQYGAAADNPELQDEIRNSTDEENSRQVKLGNGIYVPVPPELRVLWGPYSSLMNEITGINAGNYDPAFASAIDAWLSGEIDVSEEGMFGIGESFKAGVESMMPIQAGSFPTINALAATQGIDLNMTRYTGSPQEIQMQDRSALGGEGTLEGDAISAQTMAVMEELISANVANFARVTMDIDRALDEGATNDDAFRVGLSRLQDQTVRSSGPARGMLFGNYERLQTANDTTTRLWYAKSEGIERARSILRQDIVQQYVTGADPRYAMLRNSDTVPPDLSGTALAPIGAVSADLLRAIRPLETRRNELRDQVKETQNQAFSTIEERNAQINEYNEEIEQLNEQLVLVARQAEDAIRQITGDRTFTWQNFDPEKYRNMAYPPVQEPTESP